MRLPRPTPDGYGVHHVRLAAIAKDTAVEITDVGLDKHLLHAPDEEVLADPCRGTALRSSQADAVALQTLRERVSRAATRGQLDAQPCISPLPPRTRRTAGYLDADE